jgi:hypothetical protein
MKLFQKKSKVVVEVQQQEPVVNLSPREARRISRSKVEVQQPAVQVEAKKAAKPGLKLFSFLKKGIKLPKVSLPFGKKLANVQIKVKAPAIAKVAKSVIEREAVRSISDFYSSRNYKQIKKMLDSDLKVIDSVGTTVAPSSARRLATQSAVDKQDVVAKLDKLAFFSVSKELQAQDILIARFPGKALRNKVEKTRHDELSSALIKLSDEVRSVYSANGISAYMDQKLALIGSEVAVFNEIKRLQK